MTVLSTLWDSGWTTTSIAATSITNTNSSTTAQINNSGKMATEVMVQVAYASGGVTQGVDVYVLRDINGAYEAPTDLPYSFQMPYASSNTYHRTFTVMADRVSDFEISLVNNSGVTVTATVSYRQSTIQIV